MGTNAANRVLIGIVIPAYNAANTLANTLNAINHIKENCREVNLYCVLIDDCSMDNTSSITKQFLDAGTIDVYFRNERNQGVSASRNIGISFCKETDYITFCDADDEFNLEGFKKIDSKLDSDLVLFDHHRRDNCTDHLVTYQFDQDLSEPLSQASLQNYLLAYLERPNKFSLWTSCWAKLFRTDIIVKNAIAFDTQMKVFEDVKFNFEFLKYAQYIKYINVSIYTHNLANSKTYSTSSTMGAHSTIIEGFAFIDALNLLSELFIQKNGYDHSKEIYHCLGAYSVITLIRSCLKINSVSSFFLIRKQIISILSSQKLIQAFKHYDAKKAEGNRLIPYLIKNKLFSFAIACSYYSAKKRYR